MFDFWATNSEEGGWNISSTDEGSQKMLVEENEKQIKIQTGTDVIDDFVIDEDTSDAVSYTHLTLPTILLV